MLDQLEEKILIRIRDSGPDHVFTHEFQDQKSQSALAGLIRLKLIKPHFELREDQFDKYVRSQEIIDREDFDLHFIVTESGREVYEQIYQPSFMFSRKLLFRAAFLALGAMLLLALWLT